jgi:hypothetical protein
MVSARPEPRPKNKNKLSKHKMHRKQASKQVSTLHVVNRKKAKRQGKMVMVVGRWLLTGMVLECSGPEIWNTSRTGIGSVLRSFGLSRHELTALNMKQKKNGTQQI